MPRVSVFKTRFFWKIYSAFSLLFLATILLLSWVVVSRVETTAREVAESSLKDRVLFLAPQASAVLQGDLSVAQGTLAALARDSSVRVTLIDAKGKVIADSTRDPNGMVDHWQRPEVNESLKKPFGIATRESESVGRAWLYVARALRDGDAVIGVARVALPMEKIAADVFSLKVTIGVVTLLGAVLALGFGWGLARRITIPISEMMTVAEALRSGRYETKVHSLSDDELGQLGGTLNRLGAELTSKVEELERLENVRRDFVANVSHEIKTPLTSIKGYVETLLSGAVKDQSTSARFLEKISRNADRLTALVQDLLDLARIEAHEDAYKASAIDLSPLVLAVTARHEDAVFAKHLKVKLNTPPQPMLVMGDREAMTQVMDNLLTNAIKYTPDGGSITVSLTAKANWARLVVEDSGIGIPAEHLGRIFERFYRVDKARSRELGGTGLGLSIVKHLVAAMEGEVSVESEVGVGSSFTVRLRLAPC